MPTKIDKSELSSPYYQYGTDAQYRRFIRTLPCCICGQFREWLHGDGVSQSAHVRIGGNGGIAKKPPYSAVPLCGECHRQQHQHGHTYFGSDEFWLKLRDKYLAMWIKRKI